MGGSRLPDDPEVPLLPGVPAQTLVLRHERHAPLPGRGIQEPVRRVTGEALVPESGCRHRGRDGQFGDRHAVRVEEVLDPDRRIAVEQGWCPARSLGRSERDEGDLRSEASARAAPATPGAATAEATTT